MTLAFLFGLLLVCVSPFILTCLDDWCLSFVFSQSRVLSSETRLFFVVRLSMDARLLICTISSALIVYELHTGLFRSCNNCSYLVCYGLYNLQELWSSYTPVKYVWVHLSLVLYPFSTRQLWGVSSFDSASIGSSLFVL
jgi:hypothetical protein